MLECHYGQMGGITLIPSHYVQRNAAILLDQNCNVINVITVDVAEAA